MGGYIGAALTAYSMAKDKAAKQKKLYDTEKALGSPWWKQGLTQVAGFVGGSTNPFWNPMDWYNRNRQGHLNDLKAKARNSTGLGGEAALKKAANSTREIMNQQLNQNIATLNQGWGGAGRYASGARQQAILQAQNSTNFNMANVVNQMSLQESQFQRNLDEERAWRQASLDAGQPGLADRIGEIADFGVRLYGSNPDFFNQKLGGLGERLGIGGGMYATPSAEPVLGQQAMGPFLSQIPEAQYGPSLQEAQAPVTQLPSFLAPPQKEAYQPSPMDLFSTQVSDWTEQDLVKNTTSLPKTTPEFHMDPDNPVKLVSSLNYIVNNHLDDGELPEIYSNFMATGDISSLITWILEKGGADIGGSTIQSK